MAGGAVCGRDVEAQRASKRRWEPGASLYLLGGTAPPAPRVWELCLRTTFSGHPSKPNLAPISPLSAEATLYTFSLQAILLTL